MAEPNTETLTPRQRAYRTHQKRRRIPKKAAFLKALERIPTVRYGCKVVRISRDTAYRWREEDPEFGASWDKAIAATLPILEDEALQRAMKESIWSLKRIRS
jgi:hypothetical protein